MSPQSDCLFCRVIARELPGTFVYEDEHVVAFKDIQPKAPVHVLVVPRQHIPSFDHLGEKDAALVTTLLFTAQQVARKLGLSPAGYRLSTNVGEHGRQSVRHLHFHLMGGRRLVTEV